MPLAIALALTLLVFQPGAPDGPSFAQRVAEFETREAQLKSTTGDARGAATLEWVRALRNVLQASPIEGPTPVQKGRLQSHDELIVYSEPAGQWLIGHQLLLDLHAQHAKSPAADEIAWLAVINGLPGECEGYVPCYAAGLNMLDGEYLRRHPRGAHRAEAFDRINESLRIAVDDLLKRKERDDYLSVPRDCADLLAGARPLRAAVAGANGARTETMVLVDRLIAYCPSR